MTDDYRPYDDEDDDERRPLFGEGSLLKKILIFGGAGIGILAVALIAFVFWCVQDLPSNQKLAEYQPPVTTRMYAGDGSLIAEFADQQRIYVPSAAIPDLVKNAFISAEDKNFRTHGGIDFSGLMRATLRNVLSIFTGDRMQGASTITQQVAKNMLLTSDRTITRKVKEAFLAQRIEKAFSKERILELYLNEIYLGSRSYGVAAAALNYFNKPLDKLTISEAAYLGALPKGPENYNPARHMEKAIARRNWVIDRMVENEFITAEEGEAAKKTPLATQDRLSGEKFVASAHFVEAARRELEAKYGKDGLYQGGLSVRSTLDTRLQIAAAAALRKGIDTYDRRHGWRGAIKHVAANSEIVEALKGVAEPPGASGWLKALVTGAAASKVTVALEDGRTGQIASEDLKWVAAAGKKRALTAGDVIYVQPLKQKDRFGLRQMPKLEGAIVAMDPHTGRVLAMVGGYSFDNSKFNRVTQAKRQPGSSFKPIVYSAALDLCCTPSTLIEDAPFQMAAGDGTIYNPENYTKEFFGNQTLRTGLEKSRNAMTVRLAYEMGLQPVVDYGMKLGVFEKPPLPVLSLSLGAGETTPMRMASAYAVFVNGGKKVVPTVLDRVQDRSGKTLFKMDQRACEGCNAEWNGQSPPQIPDTREQILDPITAYQMTSMLEGVVQRGTGTVIQSVGKPLAGKTGTTNDYKDAWFVGFSPDLVVAVWLGFDTPKSMGEGETGGSLAAPVFRDFMADALKGVDVGPFRAPPNVRFVRVDAQTGYLPTPATTQTILEAFKPGTEPTYDSDTRTFVYGGGEQIDPKALESLGGLEGAAPNEGVVAQSQQTPPEVLGTADDGEGGLF